MTLPRSIALLAATAFLCAPLQAGFFAERELEVITTTDVSPEGALLPEPSPENPAYYVAFDFGLKDLGGIIAGDKIPPNKEINDILRKVLSKRGYLPASNKNDPTRILTWFWGTFYVQRFQGGDVSMPSQQINRSGMLRFMGGEKLGLREASSGLHIPELESIAGLSVHGADKERFLEAAKDDLYVIAVACYDYEEFVKSRNLKLLWVTKIATPSRGFVLADTLPTMAIIAGPNLGRETPTPVWVSADEKFKADVILGEAQVIESDVKLEKKKQSDAK